MASSEKSGIRPVPPWRILVIKVNDKRQKKRFLNASSLQNLCFFSFLFHFFNFCLFNNFPFFFLNSIGDRAAELTDLSRPSSVASTAKSDLQGNRVTPPRTNMSSEDGPSPRATGSSERHVELNAPISPREGQKSFKEKRKMHYNEYDIIRKMKMQHAGSEADQSSMVGSELSRDDAASSRFGAGSGSVSQKSSRRGSRNLQESVVIIAPEDISPRYSPPLSPTHQESFKKARKAHYGNEGNYKIFQNMLNQKFFITF